MPPWRQIFPSTVPGGHGDFLPAASQLCSLYSSQASKLRCWEAVNQVQCQSVSRWMSYTLKSSTLTCRSAIWIPGYVFLHIRTCNGEWAPVCCTTWQKQEFYVRSGNKDTTIMLDHVIALTPVTRSLGCFPASKFDMLLEMALL